VIRILSYEHSWRKGYRISKINLWREAVLALSHIWLTRGGKKKIIKTVLISKILAVIWESKQTSRYFGYRYDIPNTENNFSLGGKEEATNVCTS